MDYVPAQANETYAQAFIREVNNDLNDVKHSFIKIGFRLTEADKQQYYKEFGYQNITELAEAEFGFKKSTTYDLMNVYALAHDRNARWHIAEYYDKFSYSQLRALTRLKYSGTAVWSIVKPTDSVRALERFVSNWNEEYRTGCGYHPELKTVQEYLNAYDKKQAEKRVQEENYPGQLPGQTAMTLEEVQTKPEEIELSTRVENSEEKNPVSEEPETLPTKEELIKYCLKNLDSEIKLNLYERYFTISDINDFTEYLKAQTIFELIGDNYWLEFVDDETVSFDFSDNSGAKILFHTELTYLETAQKIIELISFDEYLTDEEKNLFMQRESERISSAEEDPSEEATDEEPAESEEELSTRVESSVTEIESEPQQLTNREYLSALSDEQFVSELCMKIIRIFPMGGKSSQFMSTVQSKLKEWLKEVREVQ